MDRAQLIEFLEFPLGEDNMIPRMHSQAQKQWRGLIMRHAEELIEPHETLAGADEAVIRNIIARTAYEPMISVPTLCDNLYAALCEYLGVRHD